MCHQCTGHEIGSTGDYREDALNIIANLPLAVAGLFRLRAGWGEPISPAPELGYIENFVHMLGVPGLDEAGTAKLTELMRVLRSCTSTTAAGHLSTFCGKAVVWSCRHLRIADRRHGGLAGPRHGKGQPEFLPRIRPALCQSIQLAATSRRKRAGAMVRNRLANKQLIFGFGQAVLRVEDPRATVFCDLGEELCADDENFKMVQMLRKVVPGILMENPKISNPYPNVDRVLGLIAQRHGPQRSRILHRAVRHVALRRHRHPNRLRAPRSAHGQRPLHSTQVPVLTRRHVAATRRRPIARTSNRKITEPFMTALGYFISQACGKTCGLESTRGHSTERRCTRHAAGRTTTNHGKILAAFVANNCFCADVACSVQRRRCSTCGGSSRETSVDVEQSRAAGAELHSVFWAYGYDEPILVAFVAKELLFGRIRMPSTTAALHVRRWVNSSSWVLAQ